MPRDVSMTILGAAASVTATHAPVYSSEPPGAVLFSKPHHPWVPTCVRKTKIKKSPGVSFIYVLTPESDARGGTAAPLWASSLSTGPLFMEPQRPNSEALRVTAINTTVAPKRRTSATKEDILVSFASRGLRARLNTVRRRKIAQKRPTIPVWQFDPCHPDTTNISGWREQRKKKIFPLQRKTSCGFTSCFPPAALFLFL